MLSWCFVKHHAMHMWVGGVELFVYLVTCLTKVQMESCLRGFFYLFFFNLLLTCMKVTLVGIIITLMCEGGNTELLLQNCFTLHIGW